MTHRFRDLLPPSAGDALLAGATSAKVTLSRWPSADEEQTVDCEFELRGEVAVTADNAAELLDALIREFRTPRQPRQEGGASC